MSAKTARWKNAEKQWAETLKKFSIPAYRKTQRQGNFSISEDDVGIVGADWVVSDSKYRESGFATHTLIDIIEDKYCKKGEKAILITKGKNQRGQRCTVEDKFLAGLLSFFLGHQTKEEVLKLWEGK